MKARYYWKINVVSISTSLSFFSTNVHLYTRIPPGEWQCYIGSNGQFGIGGGPERESNWGIEIIEQPYRVVKDYDDGCVEGYTKDVS